MAKKHAVLKPSFVRTDERGIFRELLNRDRWESLVQGEMKAGAVLGNHYHKKTRLFFMVLSGEVEVATLNVQTNERDDVTLQAFEGMMIEPYETHRMIFKTDGSFLFLKSKQYDPDNSDTYHHPVE